jgi:hypothetical protein
MPTITVNIAKRGTPLKNGKTSSFGHMWVTMDNGSASINSYGFYPSTDASPYSLGSVHSDDNDIYQKTDSSITFSVSQAQYNKAQAWAENAKNTNSFGYYVGPTNNCIDFSWNVLKQANIDISNRTTWEGKLLPSWNIPYIEDLMYDYYRRKEYNKETTRTKAKEAHDRYWDARDYRLTRIDPLIFDLNNDGITTTDARTTPVLFDHDGDGIKNGTGWVSKEDGFLVVDRNKPKKLLPKFAYLNKVV